MQKRNHGKQQLSIQGWILWDTEKHPKSAAETDSYSDIAIENSKGKFVFLGNKCIPAIFNTRMLAYTDTWRAEENQKNASYSIWKIVWVASASSDIY